MLTSTHAISLFPHTTFIHEETYNCRDLSNYPGYNAPWMAKYRKRGFNVYVASDRLPRRFELTAWKRKVGDSMTWIMPYRRAGGFSHVILIPFCVANTRTGLTGKVPTLAPYNHYAFEVLDSSFAVAPPGAVNRVGPRFVYRRVARCNAAVVMTNLCPLVPWLGSGIPATRFSRRPSTPSRLPQHLSTIITPCCRQIHLTTPLLARKTRETLRRQSNY